MSLFRKTNKEVLFVYSPIDDFVMTNVGEFNGRKVVSAENAKLDIEDSADASAKKLTEDDKQLFGAWLKLTLEESVKEVKVSRIGCFPDTLDCASGSYVFYSFA